MQIEYLPIKQFWENNPCAGGNKYFPFPLYHNKKVLEIGCGHGVDAKRFVKAKAKYTGIDLTDIAVELTRTKIGRKSCVFRMNAENIDFPDNHFDLVYSWGVIHHALSPEKILEEAYRVLKPNGRIYVMVYGKPSWRYNIDIMILRKILWHLHYYKYKEIRKDIPRPTKDEWISMNTDNIGCPLSRVYTKDEAIKLLYKFNKIKTLTNNRGWFRILTGVK